MEKNPHHLVHRKCAQIEEAVAPEGQAKVYFLDGSCKPFDVTPATTVGQLLADVKVRLGIANSDAFALFRSCRVSNTLSLKI